MAIDNVTVWWDRYGIQTKMNKINEMINAINSKASNTAYHSIAAVMLPQSGASWLEWYRALIYLDGLNEKVSWSAGIPIGYSYYRYVVWYTFSQTGVSLRHWSGKWKDGDTLSFNVQNSSDIMYGFAGTTKMDYYAHSWQSIDDTDPYAVGG